MKKSSLSLGLFAILAALPAHASGVPQLDPASYPSQLFWLAISFVFMLFLVRSAIAPNIEQILTHRKESIQNSVREAELYRARATQANQDMTAVLLEARSGASSILADAQNQAAQRAGETMHALDQELKTKLMKAETGIANAKATAMGELQEHAATLTKSIVEKLLDSNIDASDALNVTRKVS